MKIIVCGAGQVGHSIARYLADEHNDVTVIDNSADLIERISGSLDVSALVGYASHPEVLDRAGAATADMIIAATRSDEVNMIACQVAHSLFNVPLKIARIRTQDYIKPEWRDLFSRDNLPIDVIISPEQEVARAIYRRLEVLGAFETVPFADGKIQIIGVPVREDCPVVDTPLNQLTEIFSGLNILVVGIQRDNMVIVPRAEDQILVGDNVFFTCDVAHRERALAAFGFEAQSAGRVVVVGGGNVGRFLAREIERLAPSINLKIIEESETRASLLAEEVTRAIVLHGDALDSDILREANVREADVIVAVANDDEVNILSSLLAKREGAKRAIALINKSAYQPLMSELGVDTFIDPRATTVSTILQHVRRGRIRSLSSLAGGQAEAIEAVALETSSLVNKPLRELNMPDGVLIGALVRGDDVIIPRGDTEIYADDRVILFALADQVRKVEQMFAVQLEYF